MSLFHFFYLTTSHYFKVSLKCKIILKFITWDSSQRLLISQFHNLVWINIVFQKIWCKFHFIIDYKTFNFFQLSSKWVDAVCLHRINHVRDACTKKHSLCNQHDLAIAVSEPCQFAFILKKQQHKSYGFYLTVHCFACS